MTGASKAFLTDAVLRRQTLEAHVLQEVAKKKYKNK